MPLTIKSKENSRYDLVALGEIMLRFDPGDRRVATTRSFDVYEGGGEYNVARGLKRCFGLDTAVVTAFADNPVGRLAQDLIYQGGVDQKFIRWVDYDGVGRSVRNGLNFTERGFGVRGAVGCSDRGHTATSQMKPGDVDWDDVFGKHGARWFHTGGIFCALSETTPEVALEAMQAARRHGTVVSYDLNYRASLWKAVGGKKQAQAVNRRLAPLVDVMIGNEEDFSACLGFEVPGLDENITNIETAGFQQDDRVGGEGVPVPGGGDHAAQGDDGIAQRLGRAVLLRWRVLPGAEPAGPGDLRPRGRRRRIRLGPDLRIPHRPDPTVGGGMRRRARRAGHDHAW